MADRLTLWDVAIGVTFTFLCGAALAGPKAPGPLGLPSVETLQEKLTMSPGQAGKVETIYEAYRNKAKDVDEKGDLKKKAEVRHEIIGKIKEVCTGGQKKRLDQIVSEKEKK